MTNPFGIDAIETPVWYQTIEHAQAMYARPFAPIAMLPRGGKLPSIREVLMSAEVIQLGGNGWFGWIKWKHYARNNGHWSANARRQIAQWCGCYPKTTGQLGEQRTLRGALDLVALCQMHKVLREWIKHEWMPDLQGIPRRTGTLPGARRENRVIEPTRQVIADVDFERVFVDVPGIAVTGNYNIINIGSGRVG